MKTVSLKLSDDLHKSLTRTARQRKTTKTAVLRAALEAFLASHPNRSRVTCWDLASDLAGSVSGPADLATNPKYMEGFGR